MKIEKRQQKECCEITPNIILHTKKDDARNLKPFVYKNMQRL
jgi:hypothetical protein